MARCGVTFTSEDQVLRCTQEAILAIPPTPKDEGEEAAMVAEQEEAAKEGYTHPSLAAAWEEFAAKHLAPEERMMRVMNSRVEAKTPQGLLHLKVNLASDGSRLAVVEALALWPSVRGKGVASTFLRSLVVSGHRVLVESVMTQEMAVVCYRAGLVPHQVVEEAPVSITNWRMRHAEEAFADAPRTYPVFKCK